jgi:predicted GNAT family acetyltransferase
VSFVRSVRAPARGDRFYRGEAGVWPLATAGLAAVIRYALAETSPVVSLYVNDFNAPALTVYRRLGFTESGALMSVLF